MEMEGTPRFLLPEEIESSLQGAAEGAGGVGFVSMGFAPLDGSNWVCLKIKQEGKPQVLVHVSTYQGNPFWDSGFLVPVLIEKATEPQSKPG